MTKRKASIALDEDNQSDQGLNDVNARTVGDITAVGDGSGNGDNSSLADDDNVNNNRPATNQLMTQNGSSSGIIDGRTVKIQSSSNQNDNSNSSSIGNGNGTSNTVGGTNQQLNKGKKERADNWSNAEIQVLHRGIETRRDIFYGPPSQATKKNRELAWDAITKEVNAVSTTPRTLSQVMKKFKNEKCRAKRKFVDTDKDGPSNNQLVASGDNGANVSNNNTNNDIATTTANDVTSNLRAQQQQQTANHNAASSNQQQQLQHQTHLMATTASAGGSAETMAATQATSINVVKLAPQNVAKTMIDLPGHVQHTIQMPNDDMVLIVPPDMDGLLSGVNIVSDGTGHHHFQKCSSNTLGNHQHSHHNQHAIQTLNTNQGLMNGTMSNGMMTRAIPAGSMCSLVYSTGNEMCGPEHQLAGQGAIAPNHIAVSAQNLVHHRGLDQGHPQQLQMHHTPQATHQQHQQHPQQQQQQHPQQQQQQQQQHQHQQHQQHHHHHHHQQQPQQQHVQSSHAQSHPIHHQHLTQNHLTPSASSTGNSINAANSNGVAVESQLKNLLFNLLLKDGQGTSVSSAINSTQDCSKQRNEMLAIIASSLTKIEGHLGKISKVAGALFGSNNNLGESLSGQIAAQAQQMIESGGGTVPATAPVVGDNGNGGLAIASDNNND